jgi:hypothetical protein
MVVRRGPWEGFGEDRPARDVLGLPCLGADGPMWLKADAKFGIVARLCQPWIGLNSSLRSLALSVRGRSFTLPSPPWASLSCRWLHRPRCTSQPPQRPFALNAVYETLPKTPGVYLSGSKSRGFFIAGRYSYRIASPFFLISLVASGRV